MKSEVVVLCIGSNQITGDSLGPLVGEYLKRSKMHAYVYGTMDRPVNAKNLTAYVDMIKAHHKDSLLVVVDATVGEREDIGRIRINRNGVKPGGAVNKNLPRIGDIGVLGVVARKSKNLVSTLLDVRMKVVDDLAIKISTLLLDTLSPRCNSAG